MEVGVSYKQTAIRGTYDAIVIGSGIGGLAAAAILAKRGKKRVLVLERHYTAGGYTHSFTRRGYEWDVGVHYIGMVGRGQALRRAYDWLTDGRLEWAAMPDVYDRIYLGDRAYDYVTGWRRFVSKMKSYFPGEEAAIATSPRCARATAWARRTGPSARCLAPPRASSAPRSACRFFATRAARPRT